MINSTVLMIVGLLLSTILVACVIWIVLLPVWFGWCRSTAKVKITVLLAAAVLLLVLDVRYLNDVLFVGWRSKSWPSVAAEPVRFHLIGIPSNPEAAKYKLELPYVYRVGDSFFRGSSYDSRGQFVGSRDEIQALRGKFAGGMQVHYKPNDPSQSLLRPGVAFDSRVTVVVALVTLLLTASAVIAVRSGAAEGQTRSRESWAEFSLALRICAVIGLALFFMYGAASRWRLYALEARMTGGYTVVAEAALDNGVEYWIAVYPNYKHDTQFEPEWVQDQVDTKFLADDGTLKPIEYRRWNVYRDADFREAESIPQQAPDLIVEWREDTGLTVVSAPPA